MSRGIYDKTNKVRIPMSGINAPTIDSALSTTSTNPVQNKKIKEAVDDDLSAITGHETDSVNSQDGVHGFRVVDGALEYNDDGWKGILSEGSLINVSTLEEDLYGRPVSLSDGTTTLTGTFSNDGHCSFEGVMLSGELTVSSTTSGGDTAEDTIEVPFYGTYSVELELPALIYGVSWDGSSSPSMTRTDAAASFSDPVSQMSNGSGGWTTGSSPFDNILPWSGMQIVEDADAGTLVSIPKYYYKWTKTGSAMTLQISMKQFEGSHVSPAHADRGDGNGERDVVYVGKYHCATSTYKSTTGVKPQVSKTRANFRTNIHNLGSDIWQYDFAMWWTINMLYIVEFANWNSQAKIGYGCGNNSSVGNMGYTDSMTYHTGTTQTSRTTYGLGTQYRHIEGLWDNVLDWCDGIYFSDSNMYVINNPSSFSDTTDGTKVGTRKTSNGYPSAWNVPSTLGYEWALFPSAVVGSDSTYICDYYNYNNSSGVVLCVGGYYNRSLVYGGFYLDCYWSATDTRFNTGSRLMKLPNNT